MNKFIVLGLFFLFTFAFLPNQIFAHYHNHDLLFGFKGGTNIDGFIDYKPKDDLSWKKITTTPTLGSNYGISFDIRVFKPFFLYWELNRTNSRAKWTIYSDKEENSGQETYIDLNTRNYLYGLKLRIYYFYIAGAFSFRYIKGYDDPYFNVRDSIETEVNKLPEYIEEKYYSIDYCAGFNFKLSYFHFLLEVHYDKGFDNILKESPLEFKELIPGGFKIYFGLCIPCDY